MELGRDSDTGGQVRSSSHSDTSVFVYKHCKLQGVGAPVVSPLGVQDV
jgi:hypothetical protein